MSRTMNPIVQEAISMVLEMGMSVRKETSEMAYWIEVDPTSDISRPRYYVGKQGHGLYTVPIFDSLDDAIEEFLTELPYCFVKPLLVTSAT